MAVSSQRRGGRKYYQEMAAKSHAARIKREVKVGVEEDDGALLYVTVGKGRLFLRTRSEVTIRAGETIRIHSGAAVTIEEGYLGFVIAPDSLPCSGLAVSPVEVINGANVVVVLTNQDQKTTVKVGKGVCVATVVVCPELRLRTESKVRKA